MTASPTEAEPAREMVEAVAKALHEHDDRERDDWSLFSKEWQDKYRARARAAIAAIHQLDPAFLHPGSDDS